MSCHEADGHLLCIHSVVIDEKYRRKGLGSKMMTEYIKQIKVSQPQVKKMALLCKEHLRGFYAKAGFTLLGPSAVVHGQDLWYDMQLDT
mmetsp:Transcript_23334/g.36507  ORF Transcript_23334/g.36507 Transcript_23334/m.36507 type:complete len:89 (+) Transcript_23334:122-388(+)